MAQAQRRKPNRSKGKWLARAAFSRWIRLRSFKRMWGISILTGQTSPQAPQREDAKGCSSASSKLYNCGVRMAPMGPW